MISLFIPYLGNALINAAKLLLWLSIWDISEKISMKHSKLFYVKFNFNIRRYLYWISRGIDCKFTNDFIVHLKICFLLLHFFAVCGPYCEDQ